MGTSRYGVRDEVRDTAESFYRALTNKNLRAIEDTWAQVPYAAVAGRSGQLRQGWNEVRRYWEQRFRELGDIKVAVKLHKCLVHAVGDVAWLSGIEFRTIVEGEMTRREELRMTAVLQRVGDRWQIVSYHVSEPAQRHEEARLAS